MRLPIIKHFVNFMAEKDRDFLLETIETLEALTEVSSLRDEELDVIGELLSNMYGAIEVQHLIDEGASSKEAMNQFMSRVTGSIDK